MRLIFYSFPPTTETGFSLQHDVYFMFRYPKGVKRQVRGLVKRGVPKCDIVKITGLKRCTVYYFTRDMKGSKGNARITGVALNILRNLVSKGYAFPEGCVQANNSYHTIKKYFPVKRVELRSMTMFILEGKERNAMEAFLKRRNFRSISWQKLGCIRRTFGIKNVKYDNKIIERNLK